MDHIFAGEHFIHIAALFYLGGFLFRNQIMLRGLIIAGDIVYILYFYFAPETPLWGGIFWSAMFCIVNATMIGIILADGYHFRLTTNERRLFDSLADLTPGQFRQLMKIATEGTAVTPVSLTKENERLHHLYFVLDGQLVIEKNGHVARTEGGTFIGEIAFLLSRPATASVTLEPGGTYFAWEADKLHKLLSKSDELDKAVSAIMNKKLAYKVAISSVTALTPESAPR
jgi:hypothetical protein